MLILQRQNGPSAGKLQHFSQQAVSAQPTTLVRNYADNPIAWICHDLDSWWLHVPNLRALPCLINSQKMRNPYRLQQGDEITLDEMIFRVVCTHKDEDLQLFGGSGLLDLSADYDHCPEWHDILPADGLNKTHSHIFA